MQYPSQDVPKRNPEHLPEKQKKRKKAPLQKSVLNKIIRSAKAEDFNKFKKYCSDKYKIDDKTFKTFIVPASKRLEIDGTSTNINDKNYYVIHGMYNQPGKGNDAEVSFHFYKYADDWKLVDVTPDTLTHDPSKFKVK